jgi:hypothetical protein
MELNRRSKIRQLNVHIVRGTSRSRFDNSDISIHRVISDQTPHLVAWKSVICKCVRRAVDVIILLIATLVVVEFPDFSGAASVLYAGGDLTFLGCFVADVVERERFELGRDIIEWRLVCGLGFGADNETVCRDDAGLFVVSPVLLLAFAATISDIGTTGAL